MLLPCELAYFGARCHFLPAISILGSWGRDAWSADGSVGVGWGRSFLLSLWGVVWGPYWLELSSGGNKDIVVSYGVVRYVPGLFVFAWKSVTSSTVTRPLRSTVFWKGSPETYVSSQDGTCYLLFCPCYF